MGSQSYVDPEWAQFSSNVPIPTLVGSPVELRQMMEGIKALRPYTEPVGHTIRDQAIDAYQGAKGTVRIYTPDEVHKPAKTIIYLHGGGWTIGDLVSEDGVCRLLCTETKSIIVSVDYRKAPENPFPVPLEDAWAGVLWTFANIDSLGGSADNVYILGNSAGANMASVLTQRARDSSSGPVRFRGLILRNPMVCHPQAHPKDLKFDSYIENKDAALLSAASVHNFADFYNPPPNDTRFSSLLTEDFTALPPTYMQVSGGDPLRDDGLNYAQKLESAR
ncbi:hypothetical protein A1O3_03117 [Capronia epimyces CBS 606.96]|uniref:Alpha/beta hydrolase fold-3 domain-containing protein n=1 Tax=Capronia epimyces CBS 606.96 TaxID=1182542 RepID=W9Z6D0_9EURO|nr:uncharacterized protein A1O3_03117 [Capronia epimyces CBS 606.96]EXJ90049.1 hypothetical protein A1O3_03117 [Capronia epimyces CBS 606.96]